MIVSNVRGTFLHCPLHSIFFFSYNLRKAPLLLCLIFLIGDQGLDLLISNLPAFRFSPSEICNLCNPTDKEGVT